MVWTTKPPAGTQLDFTNPINNGLVGCWIFNEGTGTVVTDLSGNNNNGNLINMIPSSTSGWNVGKDGQPTLIFDGIDDSINIANNNSLTIIDNLTVLCSFKYKTETVDKRRFLVNKSHWSNILGFFIEISSIGNYIALWTGGTQGWRQLIIYTPLISNNWYTLIATTDSTISALYLNGVQIGSRIIEGLINCPCSLTIGNDTGNNFPFDNAIDDVRIWNRTLNVNEIQSLNTNLYSAFQDSLCPPLICTLSVA